MTVVSDTTAISNIFQIGALEILQELYGEITITPGVHRELSRVEDQAVMLRIHES